MSKVKWLVVVLLVAGCAEVKYDQEGMSFKETEQDYFACEDKVLAEHEGLRKGTAKEKQAWMDECMTAKGYKMRSQH